MSQHDCIILTDFQKSITKIKSKYFVFEKWNAKKGVGESIGVFCKQGGSPHNTKGLKYKNLSKLVNLKKHQSYAFQKAFT